MQKALQAQAMEVGLWQEHDGFVWWQSGLAATGANLVVESGNGSNVQQIQRLVDLMLWPQKPVGWLIWPGRQMKLIKNILAANKFHYCETLSLLSMAAASFVPRQMSIKTTLLNISNQTLFCDFLTICHQIPKCYANVVSRAFLLNLSSEIKMQTWAVLKKDNSGSHIIASITACLMPGRFGPIGGLFWLGTVEKHRSKGYASQLVVDANEWLITNGAIQVFVQSTARAHSLYKSLGFMQNGSMEFWGYSP